MQEEIENRTVTLIISAVKLTARELKAGMDKYLSEKKSKAMEKARAASEKPSGKQTVRQLIGQNQGVSNIEITNSNIKGFERIARKYGVDFAVKKDRSVSPPKYFVFFKARDADALTAAFKEYTAYELKRAAKAQNRPSVLAHLQALKAKVQAISICRTRTQGTPLISKSISPQGWCRKRMRSTRCSMRAASERTSPPPSRGGFSYRYG